MRTVIISAGGEAKRWNNYLKVPKHLIKIHDQPILHRTVDQLRVHKPDQFYIVAKKKLIEGVLHVEPENNPQFDEANKIYSSRKLWSETDRTIILFGDTYFTNEAMETIMGHKDAGFWVFGRPFESQITGKPYGEIYAFTFYPENIREIEFCLDRITKLEDRGVLNKANVWALYRAMLKLPDDLMDLHIVSEKNFVNINDFTEDFDYPVDYERFVERFYE